MNVDKLTDALFLLRRFRTVTKMHVGSKVWDNMLVSLTPTPFSSTAKPKTTFLGVSVIIDHQHPYREPEFE